MIDATLYERVKTLEAALAPFAEMGAELHGRTNANSAVIHKLGAAKQITVGDLIRAHKALQGKTP